MSRFFSHALKRWIAVACLIFIPVCLSTTSSFAQKRSENKPASSSATKIPSGIAWYGVLKDGLAEAEASNRPILLLSAAPQCTGIPGMW